mmetsp:Transcript_29069/g.35441  ORF Transcript_29069/g.35441 Transcript_29069/m.35441 type:complete len:219 (+) Transcript_29069:146-802(+)
MGAPSNVSSITSTCNSTMSPVFSSRTTSVSFNTYAFFNRTNPPILSVNRLYPAGISPWVTVSKKSSRSMYRLGPKGVVRVASPIPPNPLGCNGISNSINLLPGKFVMLTFNGFRTQNARGTLGSNTSLTQSSSIPTCIPSFVSTLEMPMRSQKRRIAEGGYPLRRIYCPECENSITQDGHNPRWEAKSPLMGNNYSTGGKPHLLEVCFLRRGTKVPHR